MTVCIPIDRKLHNVVKVWATVFIWKLRKPCSICGKTHVILQNGKLLHTCRKQNEEGEWVDALGVNPLEDGFSIEVDASYTKTRLLVI